MNINPSAISFNANVPKTELVKRVVRFRVPGKDNTTIVTDLTEVKDKFTKVEYRIMKKGKELEQKTYQNKKGFEIERFATICENIQTKVREGYNFLDELICADLKALKK